MRAFRGYSVEKQVEHWVSINLGLWGVRPMDPLGRTKADTRSTLGQGFELHGSKNKGGLFYCLENPFRLVSFHGYQRQEGGRGWVDSDRVVQRCSRSGLCLQVICLKSPNPRVEVREYSRVNEILRYPIFGPVCYWAGS